MIYFIKMKLIILILIIQCTTSDAISFTKNELACLICKCTENYINCSSLQFSELPKFDNNTVVTNINLDYNSLINLRQFPKLVVYSLSITNNKIMRIDDSAFINLDNLTILDLSNNLLTSDTLMPSVFRGKYASDLYEPLRHLRNLNLANNFLHSLEPKIFEHIPYLDVLNLSGNPFGNIDLKISIALSSLSLLKELNLAQTSLKTLSNYSFHNLNNLEILNLADNLFIDVPREIQNGLYIKWLCLDGNPIKYIKSKSLNSNYLQVLHLNRMPELCEIKSRALSQLPKLEEFYCSDNAKFEKIASSAFTAISEIGGKGESWPYLKVLVMKNNSLRYIESNLIGSWDYMMIIDLQENHWVCDCENQWLVSTLIPLIETKHPQMLSSFKCYLPVQMKDIHLIDLYHRNYHLRCLDIYNHMPEKDAELLINICVISLIFVPFIMIAILYCRRKSVKPLQCRKWPFFKDQQESFDYLQLKTYSGNT